MARTDASATPSENACVTLVIVSRITGPPAPTQAQNSVLLGLCFQPSSVSVLSYMFKAAANLIESISKQLQAADLGQMQNQLPHDQKERLL